MKKVGKPLLLFIIHGAMMVSTILLLEISPFFRELTMKKIIPAGSKLFLLKKGLVVVWVECRINLLVTEESKEAFM
jgi:hypothetical protein